MGRILSFHSNKRGQALIEFAFILPFLLVIVGGIVDFGLAFFVGQVIVNAAREGARAGAVVRSVGGEDFRQGKREPVLSLVTVVPLFSKLHPPKSLMWAYLTALRSKVNLFLQII